MKNATVTINYEAFQTIKEKADKYDAALKEKEEVADIRDALLDMLATCIKKANEQTTAPHKQFFIAEGIKAICKHYDMDLETEFGKLNEGKAPKE